MPDPLSTILETARLELRRLRDADAQALLKYRGLPEVCRFQSWENFTLADAYSLIESSQSAIVPGNWIQLAIVHRASDTVIGDCGIHPLKESPQQVELGITIDPSVQGQGYASEAILRVLRCVFESLNAHRVFAVVDELNTPAVALFRRLGWREEGHLIENVWFKGKWGSEYLFALLRKEWNQRTRHQTT